MSTADICPVPTEDICSVLTAGATAAGRQPRGRRAAAGGPSGRLAQFYHRGVGGLPPRITTFQAPWGGQQEGRGDQLVDRIEESLTRLVTPEGVGGSLIMYGVYAAVIIV